MNQRNNPTDDRSGNAFDPEEHPGNSNDSPGDETHSTESSTFGAGLHSPPDQPAARTTRSRRGGRRKRGRGRGPNGSAGTAAGLEEPSAARRSAPPVTENGPPPSDRAADDELPVGRRLRSARRVRPEGDAPVATSPPPERDGGPGDRKKRRRRRRRKGARSGTEAGGDDGSPDAAHEDRAAPLDQESPGPRAAPRAADESQAEVQRKRRRRRGGRGRRRAEPSPGAAVAIELIPGEEDDLPAIPRAFPDEGSGAEGEDSPAPDEAGGGRKRRKKKRRSSRGKKVGGRAAPASGETAAATDLDDEEGEEEAAVDVPRDQLILVNAIDFEEKRVTVIENGRIVDLLMTVESQDSLVSDIYRGKVVNLEPAIGAAFIDFGQGRNGFLHTSDVLSVYGEEGFTLDRLLTTHVDPHDWDENSSQPSVTAEIDEPEEPSTARGRDASEDRPHRGRNRLPISDLLKVGDYVVVQVTKDAIGDKGPTLTTYISIPGRYLVLMPSMERTGVSRKIEDEKERRRLKRILQSMKVPPGMGVIVRTAGIGMSKAELRRDLDYLLGVWDNFGRRLKSGRGPMPLYQESDVAIRTLRDLFSSRTEAVIVDDPMVHEKLVEFTRQVMPEDVDRIRMLEGEKPIFNHYAIEQDFEKVFARRIELPSGGSIVFDQTEALVAIDVNSGRTRSDGFDFEDIALKTNLDAVPEIVRQMRLRDLGGIIVCDFIDMMRATNIRNVERAFRTELAKDRARSKIGRISQFGLLEMTRQRLGPGTHKKVFQACPRCRGTGSIRTVQSRAAAILRRLGAALTQKGFSTVDVRAHPEVVDYLREDLQDYLRALEHRFEKEIHLTGVPDQPEDSVLRYLRADGREVRPGGRRKR